MVQISPPYRAESQHLSSVCTSYFSYSQPRVNMLQLLLLNTNIRVTSKTAITKKGTDARFDDDTH
jgi:hypothetical protein